MKETNGPRAGSFCYYETFIPRQWGKFVKWMNNYNKFEDILPEHPHIEAFVHFIYHRTKGVMTIMDIQGKFIKPGGKGYAYRLSDPAYISSNAGTFGETDLG